MIFFFAWDNTVLIIHTNLDAFERFNFSHLCVMVVPGQNRNGRARLFFEYCTLCQHCLFTDVSWVEFCGRGLCGRGGKGEGGSEFCFIHLRGVTQENV